MKTGTSVFYMCIILPTKWAINYKYKNNYLYVYYSIYLIHGWLPNQVGARAGLIPDYWNV